MGASGEARAAPPAPHRWPIRAAALLLTVALTAAGLELSARTWWWAEHGVPFARPSRVLYAWYPKLARIDRARPSVDDATFDVLLLGGSVLHKRWGAVPQLLRERLSAQLERDVRIFNLADDAQTTHDSRTAYAAIEHARFEWVLVYHGINEARANNVPPALFRPDYGHYVWYELVDAMAPYHGRAWLALPYTLRYAGLRLRQRAAPERYVGLNEPREDWLAYGSVLHSTASFRANLEAILETARARGDRVVLATFATYVPDGYSREAFLAGQLDYNGHRFPVETWGRREHVEAAVAAHNEVVRELAARFDVDFVEIARAMPGTGVLFQDICHFTRRGSEWFVDEILREADLGSR